MPPFDQTHRAQLRNDAAYELYAVDEFRFRVYLHRDAAVNPVRHTLGHRTTGGIPAIHRTMIVEPASFSDPAIRALLQSLRPLLFGTAFKALDLMVEWLLQANNAFSGRTHWPMPDKVRALRGVTTLPPEIGNHAMLWRALVETYVKLIEPRHVLVHRAGVQVRPNGDIAFATQPALTLLTDSMQGALARAISLLVNSFSGTRELNTVALPRLEGALAELTNLHGVTGLNQRNLWPVLLTVDVPETHVRSRAPLECIVDFDEIDETWRRLEAEHPQHVVVGKVCIQPTSAQIAWSFDPDNLPAGRELVMREGDPAFDSYIVRS